MGEQWPLLQRPLLAHPAGMHGDRYISSELLNIAKILGFCEIPIVEGGGWRVGGLGFRWCK